MKICVDCEFAKKEVVQVAPTQMATVLVCQHQECRDPVNGEPMPAQAARQMAVMCGFDGKYYKKKPEEPVVKETKENVIVLS